MPTLLQRFQSQQPSAAIVAEDAELVAHAKLHLEAFGAIYDRHFAGVYGYAHRVLGSAERAEDAAQQVFEQALAALPRYRESGKFRSWLYAIAYRVVQDHLRRHRLVSPIEAADDVSDPERSPEEQAVDALERHDLLAAIARLPPDQRRVVELRIEGLKGREIAAELGRSHEAVRMLQQRALDRLAADLTSRDRRGGGRHGA